MLRGKKPNWVSNLASDRIAKLLLMAEQNKTIHPERSRRYVELARKISSRYNVRMTAEQRSLFCRRCDSYFTAGNSKTRIVPKLKAKVLICVNCGFKRIYGKSHETN
jgi:ribonuclease P protein subunit RPR2